MEHAKAEGRTNKERGGGRRRRMEEEEEEGKGYLVTTKDEGDILHDAKDTSPPIRNILKSDSRGDIEKDNRCFTLDTKQRRRKWKRKETR